MGRNKQLPMSPADKAWATRHTKQQTRVPRGTTSLTAAQKAWQTRRGGKLAFPRRTFKPSFRIIGGPSTKWFAVEGEKGQPLVLNGIAYLGRFITGYVVAYDQQQARKISQKYFGTSQILDVERNSPFQPGAFDLNYQRIGS